MENEAGWVAASVGAVMPLPLDDGDEDTVRAPGWAPGGELDVERGLRALDRAAARFDAVRHLATEWRAEIDAWERRELAKLSGPATETVLALEGWALAQRRATGSKSFSFPSGSIETRAGIDKIVVDDEGGVIEWAMRNAPAAVKVETSLLRSKLPKHRKVTGAQGPFVVEETGEVVPGVRVVAGSVSTSATVTLASQRALPSGSG